MKSRKKSCKIFAVYLLCVIIVISPHLTTYISILVGKQMGRLGSELLSVSEFQLKGLDILNSNTLHSLTDDPWMILSADDRDIYTVEVICTYSKSPHEICIYYSTSENQPFSSDDRVWPVEIDTNTYLFTLPKKHLHSLRLDICSTSDNEITFEKIEINNADSFNRILFPTGWDFFSILFFPLYLTSVALAFVEFGRYIVKKCVTHKNHTNQQ